MNVGKVFAVLPIAFFWGIFIIIVFVSLTNPALHQNLTPLLLGSVIVILFLLILFGTIWLIRYIKNEPGFWTNSINIKLELK